jgi:4-amino-4-deoxy-L-arabinose transferase-like glycosyltransferase
MAETLTVVSVVWALYLGFRYRRGPTWWRGVLLGVACGLAALSRAEMILLVPFLAVPVVLLAGEDWRTRGRRAAATLVAAGVVVGPWVVFNYTRFEDPTFLSTNDGQTLLGANCDGVYYGKNTGLWLLGCLPDVPGDRSQVSTEYKDRAFEYIREHADRAPTVVAIRVGRLWGVYRPDDMVWYNEGEGRERWVTRVGYWFFYPLVVLAVAGAVVLRRSWDRLWPLLLPVVLVTVVGALSYGQARFRAPAEPSIVVLAAVTVDAVVRRLRREGAVPARPVAEPPAAAAPTEVGVAPER